MHEKIDRINTEGTHTVGLTHSVGKTTWRKNWVIPKVRKTNREEKQTKAGRMKSTLEDGRQS